jgi:8-oxo-dGTP pyrophosphatase MutT (NUDIX family)
LLPLSIKGIVIEDGCVWLRRNEFGRWELPGGRLDEDEQPEQTIVREVREELGLEVEVQRLIDVSVWKKDFGVHPMIILVTFACKILERTGELEYQGEAGAAQFKKVALDDIQSMADLPDVYKRAIAKYITYGTML